jgi:hypothetical protein
MKSGGHKLKPHSLRSTMLLVLSLFGSETTTPSSPLDAALHTAEPIRGFAANCITPIATTAVRNRLGY